MDAFDDRELDECEIIPAIVEDILLMKQELGLKLERIMFVNILDLGWGWEQSTILEDVKVMCEGSGLTCVSEDLPFF